MSYLKSDLKGFKIPRFLLDPLIPIFLGIHGNLTLLSHSSDNVLMYVLVNLVLIIGVLSVLVRLMQPEILLLKYLYFTVTGLLLIYLDGGVGSFFTIWLFILVMYVLFLEVKIGMVLTIIVPFCYALLFPFSTKLISDLAVIQRVFALIIIGMIAIFLNRGLIQEALDKQKLVQNADILRQSNKDLEQFAFVASHDLKAPLIKLIETINLIESELPTELGVHLQEMIRISKKSVTQMNDLITDLLSFSQINLSDKSFKQLNAEVIISKATQNVLESLKTSQVKVNLDNTAVFEANESLMVSLFQNLIQNGLKFNQSASPEVVITASAFNNEGIEFKIKDNGIGIRDTDKSKVFHIFQRLENEGNFSGTGIGLALCKRIVEMHNGEISFESIRGKGTTFIVKLPKVQL